MGGRARKDGHAAPVRFTHLELQNWRNFAAVSVALRQQVFLLGPNGSGKSNLLDVFRFLRDLAAPGGGLQQAVAKRGGMSTLRCLAADQTSDVSVKVQLSDKDGRLTWEYAVKFNDDESLGPVLKEERVVRGGEVLVARPDASDRNDRERLTQTNLQQMSQNQDFREVYDFFRSVHYLHMVPHLLRDPERPMGRTNRPCGAGFLEQIADTPAGRRKARLKKINRALRAAVPQLKEVKLERDVREVPHLLGLCEYWRPDAPWLSEEHFSDGTLRLIGLLWALLDAEGSLLLEEPELSLHPELLRCMSGMMWQVQAAKGRQVIMSTYSSDLLMDPGIGLEETLVLTPEKEGTLIAPASSDPQTCVPVEAGLSLPEAVLPLTRPIGVGTFTLFDWQAPRRGRKV